MLSPLTFHKLIVGFFATLARYSILYPKRVITVAVALTLAVAPGAMQLKLRTDGHALVNADAPEVRYDRWIREQFGIEDPVVVLVQSQHPDGIYNPETLQLVRELTEEFSHLEGINSNKVVSLATQRGFRNRPGTLHYQPLLENPRKTKAQLDELRDDLRRIELYTGTVVSFDGKSTAILIGAPSGIDRTALYRRVRDVIATHYGIAEQISITGPPVAEALLGTHILEDLGVPSTLLGASTRSELRVRFPTSLYQLRVFIAHHIGLLPIAILVMALIFQLSFRRIVATLLPMLEVGACLAFTFGLMGFLHVPVYLTIAVMPVLLTAMAITDEIHIYSRFFALLHERPGRAQPGLVQLTMDEMVCPVVNASLTTVIGFISFAFSPLPPVQAFGIFTGIGLLFCLFWTLMVLPALLTLAPANWMQTRRANLSTEFSSGAAGRFGLWAVRQRWWIVGAVALVVALTPLGLKRLVIQDSWIDGFEPDSEFSRATRAVNEQFHGMHLLNVSVDASDVLTVTVPATNAAYAKFILPTNAIAQPQSLAGQWLYVSIEGATNVPSWRATVESVTRSGSNFVVITQQREAEAEVWRRLPAAKHVRCDFVAQPHLQNQTLRAIGELGAFIEQHRDCKVGKVLSAPDYVATTRFMVRPNEPGSRFVPTNSTEIKLMWDYYRIVRGPEALREVVDTNYARSLLTIFLKEANFRDTARLMNDIRSYERGHLTSQNIRLGFAGDVAVSQSLIHSIVTTQMQSLLGSLVGIYLVTALLGRSLRWGVYAVIPCALSVLINFAVMGWLNIPLGVATSMFAAMTLGNGVDFAIHVLEGFTAARNEGLAPDKAIALSLSRTGPAVVINTLAIALGFGVLMLSQVPANARLGSLTILGIVNCLLASLLLLPVLLHWWPLKAASGEARAVAVAKTQPAP
jgi:predicted RND superfamily exporter protein